MWSRKCDECGKEYLYQRRSSRFCGSNCRAKNDGKPNPEDIWPPQQFFTAGENDPVEILQQRRQAKKDNDPDAYAAAMRKWNAFSSENQSLIW